MTPEWIAQNELCNHGERWKFCKKCASGENLPIAKDPGEWPEHMIEAECTRLLEQDGWRALRTDPVSDRGKGKGFGEKGMADHLYLRYDAIYLRANVLWVEYKSANGKPAKHQTEWHTKERARGALTWIAGVDFPASVAGFVDHYRKSGLNLGRM